MNSTMICALHAACILLMASNLSAEDWPMFRGPQGVGVSSVRALPASFNDKEGLVWKADLPGPGASSPIVFGDRIYITCYSGYGVAKKDTDQTTLTYHVLCFKPDGSLLWNKTLPAVTPVEPYKGFAALHGYASSTSVVDQQGLYTFFGVTGVSAWSHEGNLRWTTPVGKNTHNWGAGPSPVLYQDVVIVNASVESDALIALDKKTGKQRWRHQGMERSWNSPIVIQTGNRAELVVHIKNRVLAFDPLKGTPLWNHKGIPDYVCPSIAAKDNVIFVSGGRRSQTIALESDGHGQVRERWRIDEGNNVCSPVYYQGHIYWTHDRRSRLYCVNAETGDMVYEEQLEPRSQTIYASPLIADEKIYLVSRTKGIYVVAAKPEFELLAHNVFASDPSIFNASPAPLAPNRLLIRSDRALYCIGK